MTFRLLILSLLVAAATSFAQLKLPDTPQGKTVQEYFDAFNSGDTLQMRTFFLNHISASGLADRPVEARVERMKAFLATAKSLLLIKIVDTTGNAVVVEARSGRDEILTLSFEFERNSAKNIAGIGIEMGQHESVNGPPLTKKEFAAAVRRYMTTQIDRDAFSGNVLIERAGETLFKQAYGEAEKRFHVLNRLDTKFNIGSINKYITRAAVGQLLEQGKLSLDDHVGQILTDYPN